MSNTVSASLVLFNNAPEIYGEALKSFIGCQNAGVLVIVDNSAEPLVHPFFQHAQVKYIHAGTNLGFGAGHNLALAHLPAQAPYHLFLNPDVKFDAAVLPALVDRMDAVQDIAAIMPRINFEDGSLQRLCKLLPTPVDLILRRFIPVRRIQTWLNERYELHGLSQDTLSDVPTISGCFLMTRRAALEDVGGFDTRYFMYMEDVDLVRRLNAKGRVAYDPTVSVVHVYAKGSYRNRKLLGYHLASAIRYFNKWGWWFDSERRQRNFSTLQGLRKPRGTPPVY